MEPDRRPPRAQSRTPTDRDMSRRRPFRLSRRARHEATRIALVLIAAALFVLLLYFGNYLESLP